MRAITNRRSHTCGRRARVRTIAVDRERASSRIPRRGRVGSPRSYVEERERSRMSKRRPWAALVCVLTLITFAVAAGAARADKAVGSKPTAQKVVLFSSDGMRPDLMDKYASEGAMPTYAALKRTGVVGENGMTQAFPPNTGVGWYTMATGTYPAEHGSTNNTFHRTGDTISNAAERAGKKVAQVDWVGGRLAGIKGPTVDFANFFSTRGVLAAPLNATEQAGAAAFGISYQVASFAPASGWTNV